MNKSWYLWHLRVVELAGNTFICPHGSISKAQIVDGAFPGLHDVIDKLTYGSNLTQHSRASTSFVWLLQAIIGLNLDDNYGGSNLVEGVHQAIDELP